MTRAALRVLLGDAFERALGAVDLEERVRRAMPRVPRKAQEVAIVAVGKAAPAMARGALRALAARGVAERRGAGAPAPGLPAVLVVAPEGTDLGRLDGARVQVMRAAHPDPDRRSVAAARRALEMMRASDFSIALVSGGASSLVCLPRGLTLARYVRVVRAMLLGGASVRETNVVRRHLCAVKGGGLARAARGPVVTLVASDVIGGHAYDVGSGPTVPDPTTKAQARALLRAYAPRLALPPLHESLAPGVRGARRLRARFVARPEDLARTLVEELRRRGFSARRLPSSLAPAESLADEYQSLARRLRPGEALVRSAEPSVRVAVAHPGRGGRSTHVAVLVARDLPPRVAFLAGASDGVDGASGVAGAVVDASLAARASGEALARALAAFDTAPLLGSAGMTLRLGPTGSNLADIHVLARAPGER
jgi:hydroxypyruvate reductase